HAVLPRRLEDSSSRRSGRTLSATAGPSRDHRRSARRAGRGVSAARQDGVPGVKPGNRSIAADAAQAVERALRGAEARGERVPLAAAAAREPDAEDARAPGADAVLVGGRLGRAAHVARDLLAVLDARHAGLELEVRARLAGARLVADRDRAGAAPRGEP